MAEWYIWFEVEQNKTPGEPRELEIGNLGNHFIASAIYGTGEQTKPNFPLQDRFIYVFCLRHFSVNGS
jgi:hypothetical protein